MSANEKQNRNTLTTALRILLPTLRCKDCPELSVTQAARLWDHCLSARNGGSPLSTQRRGRNTDTQWHWPERAVVGNEGKSIRTATPVQQRRCQNSTHPHTRVQIMPLASATWPQVPIFCSEYCVARCSEMVRSETKHLSKKKREELIILDKGLCFQ